MIEWMTNALSKLTIDEFERTLRKVNDTYKQPCKIISVRRSEDKQAKVLVLLPTGESKLVVL